MPLIPFAGQLYSIPRSELDKYQVTPEEAEKAGFQVEAKASEGGDELSVDDLDQIAGGIGNFSLADAQKLTDPQKLKIADSFIDAVRFRKPGVFSPGPVQWYGGD